MKLEKAAGSSFETKNSDKVSDDKKFKSKTSEPLIDFSRGRDSKLGEAAASDSYRAFALKQKLTKANTDATNNLRVRAFSANVVDDGGGGGSRPAPLTFTSPEGKKIPPGQTWVSAPGTVIPELAAQDLKQKHGPAAYHEYIGHLEARKTDADWLSRFHETLGTRDTARLMNEGAVIWKDDAHNTVGTIRTAFSTMAGAGKLNQTDIDNFLLSATAPNADLGDPSLFNNLATEVFGKLPNDKAGLALKEMFFNSANKLAFGELRSPDAAFNARLDSFKPIFAAAATEVLASTPPQTQIKHLSDLDSGGRLTDFTRLATKGQRPGAPLDAMPRLGKLENLLSTAANGAGLSSVRGKMYQGVLFGMLESRGQAAHNFSTNETYRQAIGAIFTKEKNQIVNNYPQAQVAAIAARGGDKVYDGLLLGAGNKLYPPGTPYEQIPAVRPSNGQTPVGKTFYVNGISTDLATQAESLQAIADRTGMEVVGIRNSTEGQVADLAQCALDKADQGVNPAVDTLAASVYNEIKNGRAVHLIAHSQGGLITSRALNHVYNRLRADGLSKAQAEQKMNSIEVETFAAAAWTFPDGPQYVHYVNEKDLVPSKFGGGAWYPGRDAVVHRFGEDRGDMLFANHDFNDLYLSWRVPFETARSPEFRQITEALNRSDSTRISELRMNLKLSPAQIRDLANTYRHSLFEGSGRGVPIWKFESLTKTFNLTPDQTVALFKEIGRGASSANDNMFIFLNQISRRPEFQSRSSREEWKQGLSNLIAELKTENEPEFIERIEMYQRVLDYLNKLPN